MPRRATDANDLWAIVQATDRPGEMDELVRSLAEKPAEATRILEMLARGDGDQQTWVLSFAGRILGTEATPIIETIIEQASDIDARTDALHALVAIDPQSARRHLSRLRRMLRSKDFSVPVTAIWLLTRLGDVSSLPEIERLGDDQDRPWVRFSAQVCTMILGGDPQRVLDAIREHDHLRMPWLASGAALIGGPTAEAVLQDCAEGAPDKECQFHCRDALASMSARA